MKIIDYTELSREYFAPYTSDDIEIVDQIIAEVQIQGDVALRKYMTEFDELELETYELGRNEIKEAYARTPESNIEALMKAASNIEKFANLQMGMFKDIESDNEGYIYGHKIVPIDRVGCYVPGGRYPLPSAALMTVIPAKVAGVTEIVVCSPKIADDTVIAADIAGATRIFNLGGAQAIAAMAFGTNTVPKVDKIVGPGNKFVTAAKKKVVGAVGIDFIAGPSEVMILADEGADPEIVAADLLAQAEHDPLARSDLITTSSDFAEMVSREVSSQLDSLETREIASSAIDQSRIIIVPELHIAVDIVNRRAPEHLELQLGDNELVIPHLRNYGSLFVGPFSAEVFGDYCSGPNHTLPTNRAARYTGGLSVMDFIKIQTYQQLNSNTMERLIKISTDLASIEGLHAHQRAAEIRRKLM